MIDPQTKRSKGFGFVEMPSDAEAQAAITALNDKEVGGRRLKVVPTTIYDHFLNELN